MHPQGDPRGLWLLLHSLSLLLFEVARDGPAMVSCPAAAPPTSSPQAPAAATGARAMLAAATPLPPLASPRFRLPATLHARPADLEAAAVVGGLRRAQRLRRRRGTLHDGLTWLHVLVPWKPSHNLCYCQSYQMEMSKNDYILCQTSFTEEGSFLPRPPRAEDSRDEVMST
ncbi:uncharacterized protein LOC144577050 isoform X2 [Callithrix jacchus]